MVPMKDWPNTIESCQNGQLLVQELKRIIRSTLNCYIKTIGQLTCCSKCVNNSIFGSRSGTTTVPLFILDFAIAGMPC
jgi:hypothetical protein